VTILIDKSAELAKSLFTENMEFSPCEVYLIDINGEAEKPNNSVICRTTAKEKSRLYIENDSALL